MAEISGTGATPLAERQYPIERINTSDGPELSPQQQIEKLLWTEMLKHSGLEKAFTPSGGEAASAFARYIVEAIAEDISLSHPLGLDVYRDAAATLNKGE